MTDSGKNSHVASWLTYRFEEKASHSLQSTQLSVPQMWCFASITGPRVTGM